MKERPILFSGPMVRAILEGNKTQTRRVAHAPPGREITHVYQDSHGFNWAHVRRNDGVTECWSTKTLRPQYGDSKDRLWVRETWRVIDVNAGIEGARFLSVQFGDFHATKYISDWRERIEPLSRRDRWVPGDTGINFGRWRPSIHMPRWASRITLEITDIRVERLQTISIGDIEREGIDCGPWPKSKAPTDSARARYAQLWNSLNSKRGFSYESNPWVWVIQFKRIEADAQAAA